MKERNQRAKPQKAISMHSQQHKVNFQHEPLKENTQEKIYTKKKKRKIRGQSQAANKSVTNPFANSRKGSTLRCIFDGRIRA